MVGEDWGNHTEYLCRKPCSGLDGRNANAVEERSDQRQNHKPTVQSQHILDVGNNRSYRPERRCSSHKGRQLQLE